VARAIARYALKGSVRSPLLHPPGPETLAQVFCLPLIFPSPSRVAPRYHFLQRKILFTTGYWSCPLLGRFQYVMKFFCLFPLLFCQKFNILRCIWRRPHLAHRLFNFEMFFCLWPFLFSFVRFLGAPFFLLRNKCSLFLLLILQRLRAAILFTMCFPLFSIQIRISVFPLGFFYGPFGNCSFPPFFFVLQSFDLSC